MLAKDYVVPATPAHSKKYLVDDKMQKPDGFLRQTTDVQPTGLPSQSTPVYTK